MPQKQPPARIARSANFVMFASFDALNELTCGTAVPSSDAAAERLRCSGAQPNRMVSYGNSGLGQCLVKHSMKGRDDLSALAHGSGYTLHRTRTNVANREY